MKEHTPLVSAQDTPVFTAMRAAGLSETQATAAGGLGEAKAPAVDSAPVAGNLGKVTTLRADLEEVRLKVAIAQEVEKLHPKPAPTPQLRLPLPLPESPKPATVKQKESFPVVVSVQGVDGNATATVRFGSGALETVRPGDRLNGGIVSVVSRSGVSVQRGSSTTTLAFE